MEGIESIIIERSKTNPRECIVFVNGNGLSGKYVMTGSDFTVHGGDLFNQDSCVPSKEEFEEMGIKVHACPPTSSKNDRFIYSVIKDYFCD
jgi:FAD synthase